MWMSNNNSLGLNLINSTRRSEMNGINQEESEKSQLFTENWGKS